VRHSCGQLLTFAGVTNTGQWVYACTASFGHAFLIGVFFDAQGKQLQSVSWAKRKRLGDVELVGGARDTGYRSPLTLRNAPTSFAARIESMEQRIARRLKAIKDMADQAAANRARYRPTFYRPPFAPQPVRSARTA
jgi:hypothetical protein